MWLGKFFGFIVGNLLLGPFGGLLGLYLGHRLDKEIKYNWRQPTMLSSRKTQQTFFNTTFSVMGHIAKSDGRVSTDEINAARKIMQRMNLSAEQIQQAIHYFQQGKQPDFNLHQALRILIQHCHRQRSLLLMFLEIQFQAAKASGKISEPKKRILQTICRQLKFNPVFSWEYANIFDDHASVHRPSPTSGVSTLTQAYQLLNISANASEQDVKRAYRKQMSQHHPDKLIAKGLPETMIKLANDKTRRIKDAYEQIKKHRGFS